jgi:hypothetical protein
MPDGELACAHHGKYGHGLSCPVDPGSPSLPEKQQDSRDKGTRMTDPDPPYEIGDIPSPSYGFIYIPSPDTINQLFIDRYNLKSEQANSY